VHDFSPGILPDGLFWMIRVPDSALQVRRDSVTIRVKNAPEIDTFTFYDPLPPSGNPAVGVTTFEQTYTRSGALRHIRPTSIDPSSPFNWAGEMWPAIGSVKFSVSYLDGSWSARGSGTFASTDFGELGMERNGVFVDQP
jgi:hypothetical protein